jgi:hypothetical protein
VDVRALFGLSVLMSFIAFGIVTKLYIRPQLSVVRPGDALTELVVVPTFRFVGLSFLIPGVVSPSLPSAFATSAAYGDLVAAILAVVATLALSAHAGWAVPAVWIFNVWGAADLLHAFLPGPDSASDWSRVAGRGIFHSDGRCTTSTNYTRTNILAAVAFEALTPPRA